MISLETKGIFIGVETEFLPQQSDSMQFNFVFMYTILIENKSNDIVQLIKRKWEIADSNGDKRIIEGEGVIGEKPILLPNEKYTYSSGCNLASDYGIMKGEYTLLNMTNNNTEFKVKIPEFKLITPFKLN
jgi:ApaG protein